MRLTSVFLTSWISSITSKISWIVGWPWSNHVCVCVCECASVSVCNYTPASMKLKGGYTGFTLSVCLSIHPSVRPSVSLWTESCPLCIFHDTSRFHFIFTHLINQLQKLCSMLRFLKSLKFWQFIWNCNFDFVLCLCNINVDSWPEFLLQPLLIFYDDTSRWFTQHKFRVRPKLQIPIFHNLFSFCFPLSVCGSYHKLEFLLQSLWMAWNLTCWCILTTSELIRFWSSTVDFPHFGIILT